MREGDTVEIIAADDSKWIGKRAIILSVVEKPDSKRFRFGYYVVAMGEYQPPAYWSGSFLKLVETYEQATTRELGEGYFA